jgi:hypothetical protein
MTKQQSPQPFLVPTIKRSWFKNADGTMPTDEEWERILRVMFATMGIKL